MTQDPVELLLGLSSQVQLLACLYWLSEFEVLACIPLDHPAAFEDVASLAEIPISQLCRILRLTVTAGFLNEPHPGYIAHNALSAAFFNKPTLQDAVRFLSETALPAALRMPEQTRIRRRPHEADPAGAASANSVMISWQREPKLQRQLAAFRRLNASRCNDNIIDVLSSLEWGRLGDATVIEVGASSTATAIALTERAPGLRFIVQIRENGSSRPRPPVPSAANTQPGVTNRISTQSRILGAPQNIRNAAVYVLHLPVPTFSTQSTSLAAQITAELKAHFSMLRENTGASLILVTSLLPAPGTRDTEVEALARLNDMLLMQLANDQALEMAQLMDLINNVRDSTGRFVVSNTTTSPHHATVALELQIEA